MLSFKLKALLLSELFNNFLYFDSQIREIIFLTLQSKKQHSWVVAEFKNNDETLDNEFSGCMLLGQSREEVYLN